MNKPRLILLLGTAGAGLSTALKHLEDSGFMAVDNLPLALIDQLVALEIETEKRNLAVALDARTSGFSVDAVQRLVANLRGRFADRLTVIHLTASYDDLLRRFNATRRQHPLAQELTLREAISSDMENADALMPLADLHLDTSGIKPSELRQQLLTQLDPASQFQIKIQIVSFSYRRRMPEHVDLLLDMRFANNPHWQDGLRDQTGLDPQVAAFLAADPAVEAVISSFKAMLTEMTTRMVAEGRPLLNIGFGCTGGRHRSVWAAGEIGSWLREAGFKVSITHRELAVVS